MSRAPTAESRTLVDRWLDRVKNNRVAAVVIVAGIAIGALASLTDSARKLSDVLSVSSSADLTGDWQTTDAAPFYPIGPELMQLSLREATSGVLLGSIRFLSPDGRYPPRVWDVLDGRREGRKLALSFDSGARLYKSTETKPVALRETVVGELKGDELHLVYQREGHGGVAVVARRVQRAVAAAHTVRSSCDASEKVEVRCDGGSAAQLACRAS